VAVSCFLVLSQIAKAKYWETSHLQDLKIDMEHYETYLSGINTSLSDVKDIVHKCNENAESLPVECVAFFHQCDQMIAHYFSAVYSIDVSAKLSSLNVMRSTYPDEIAETIGGSYSSELGGLFINSGLIDSFMDDISKDSQLASTNSKAFSTKMLRNVYIHEVIHYLGFADEPEISSLMEAITESLTERVTVFNGIEYENLTDYGAIKGLASQIVDADPQMVCHVLQNGSYKIGDHIEQTIGVDYANDLRDLIFMIQQGGSSQHKEIPYFAQYIVYEYVKAVNPNGVDQLELAKYSIVSSFELKWLLGVYK